jgi:general secretion pathway protein E
MDQNQDNGPSSSHLAPPTEVRKSSDRRAAAGQMPPEGVERRQWRDRRKKKASEGRERYLDMVQRERGMLLDLGITRSTEQLLDMAGAPSAADEDSEVSVRDRANGDQLRSILPVQSWLPLNVHLIGLSEGVLKIAPLNELNERQVDALISTANRTGLMVERVEMEMWDRAELLQTLRSVHDLSADRCEKTLASWLADTDNGLSAQPVSSRHDGRIFADACFGYSHSARQ